MTRELPIFPLPIVLFPGTPQPLHIFEPRYRQLLADCVAADRRFGITYVAPRTPPAPPAPPGQPGPEADPVPNPGAVGCIALIRSTQPLPGGRSNILTVGERRFVLLRWLAAGRLYQFAQVEEFDDEPVDASEAATLVADVRGGFHRLAQALGVLAGREDHDVELSSDPQLLSFQVAAALEVDLELKRRLQALRSTTVRLRHLAVLLGPLAADAERRAVVRQQAKGNGKGGVHSQIEPAV